MKNGLLNHPRGLFVLFFTEMWERFSFYGMKALLVLYMVQYLFADPERARSVLGYETIRSIIEAFFGQLSAQAFSSHIYGWYTGFVYMTPFFGGLIADRIIGQKRSVYIGGVLMAIGHLLMALEAWFFPALVCLILGNGFFKPNISSQVGDLYEPGGSRRDRAFTIFYMGINLGAFFSPLVCGTLGQVYGWHYGFGAAGIGMMIGLVIYHLGRKHLPKSHIEVQTQNMQTTNERLTSQEIQRILALIFLCVMTVFFWGVYEQQGNTLQLWADRQTDWSIGSWTMPSTWFQSFNPFMVIFLAPVFDIFWGWQARRGKEPSSATKMAIGCAFAGAAYLFMIFMIRTVPEGQKGHFMWLAGVVLLFTIGELYLSPIGLSAVSKLAPARMVSMFMGVWFFSSFFGNTMAGIIGGYYEKMTPENFFFLLSAMGFSAGLIIFSVLRPLKKAMA